MRLIAPHHLTGLILAAAVLATPAIASYHYIHYNGRSAPFNPIYEKFNLAGLPNSTVTFFVNDQGPASFGANDSFGSVLSQIKQAAAAWNSVPTSDLRVAFGGLAGPANSTTSGGDVIFVELPPGVLGMGAPSISNVPVQQAGGSFYPILRGTVMLSRDTALQPGPSYLEAFFATTVHEMGHALGLQHTWTGSAMSPGVVRNTSRARPLDADDVAALSILYGKPNWQSNYGSISGRVTRTNGQPVALASVVAVAASGPAVSTLTDPNGNYRIDGLPTNYTYSVYAHPLPPGATQSANLRVPLDQNNQPFPAGAPFQTVFYPGTLDPAAAMAIGVSPGGLMQGVNFIVQNRANVPTYDVVTYTRFSSAAASLFYLGDREVTPAYVDANQTYGLVIARAAAPAFLPTPQSMTILGGYIPAVPNPRGSLDPIIHVTAPGTMWAYFLMPSGAGTGPRHLVFNFGDDLYVLPSGVTLVQKAPPQITAALPNADGTVTITGSSLGPDSVIYFDGLPAAIRNPVSGTDALSTVTVTPPQGVSGHVSTIAVYNADGQNSMLLQSDNPPTYVHPAAPAAVISNVSITALPAASSALIEITGQNTNFVEGQVTVGFGSNDVAVRRVWVTSPTRLLANVTVPAGASLGTSQVSVISGLSVIPQAGTFQVQPARAGLPWLNLPVTNADRDERGLYAGSVAVAAGQNLATATGNTTATLNDVPVQISATPAQINFLVPLGFPPGPAILRLHNGAVAAFPVIVQIDAAPPEIIGFLTASGLQLPGASVSTGEVVSVMVTGIDPAAATSNRVRVQVSGVEMPVQRITALANRVYQIQFALTQSFGGAQVPVTISVDGSASAGFPITVR